MLYYLETVLFGYVIYFDVMIILVVRTVDNNKWEKAIGNSSFKRFGKRQYINCFHGLIIFILHLALFRLKKN